MTDDFDARPIAPPGPGLFDKEGEADAAGRRRSGGTTSGASDAERAFGVALRYVNRRERARAEMESHLTAKGFDEAIVIATVDRLCEDGLIDDARFARLFVEDKRNLDGWGSERIARTLRERGLDRDAVAAALATGEDSGESEHDRALAVLARRFPDPPQERRDRERAFAVLVRKGYDSEVALAAVRAHTGTA